MGAGCEGSIRQTVESRSRFVHLLACETVPCSAPPRTPLFEHFHHLQRVSFCKVQPRWCAAVHQAIGFPVLSPSALLNSTYASFLMGVSRFLQSEGTPQKGTVTPDETHQLEHTIVELASLATVFFQQFTAQGLDQIPGVRSEINFCKFSMTPFFVRSFFLQLNHTAQRRHERQLYLLRKLFHLAAIKHQTLRYLRRFSTDTHLSHRVLASPTLHLLHVHHCCSTC